MYKRTMVRPLIFPFQLFTAAMGVVLLLPLQFFSLPFLFFLPGLALFLLYTDAKQADTLETVAYSLSLSLLIIPTVATLVYFAGVGIALTSAAIGLAIITISILSFFVKKEGLKPPESIREKEKRGHKLVSLALPLLLALSLALVVSVPLSKSLVVEDEGFVMNPTQASDLNFHLSIIARFNESPHIPPENPYLPEHYIVYDFFMHLFVGTLTILTGISALTIFKIAVPLLFFALSINIYVLCRRAFNNATALIAMVLYTLGGGLAWIIIIAERPSDLFASLIYRFADVAAIKYDQTILFYLLPQTQTFALVVLTFAFILWITLIQQLSVRNALIFGLILGILPYFHLITAFSLFVAVSAYVVYEYIRRRHKLAQYHLGALIVGGAIASPLLFLLLGGPNQAEIAFFTFPPFFLFLVFGLVGILGCFGAYKSLNKETSRPLIFFALCTFVALNVIALPLTTNSYRFLVYLWLPISIFASYYVATVLAKPYCEHFWSRSKALKILAVLAALCLALPTSVMLWEFYNGETYVLASSDELQAMQWIKTNTSKNAIFLEEPSTFPRIPFETGRRVVFAGELYALQYNNIDLQQAMNAIMNERSPETLSLSLQQHNVSYVFVGSHEQQYEIATTVKDPNYFEIVYSNPSVFIYKLKGS
ncbi:MAG: hypothetical protein ACXV5H_02070 [Halobacteriota archaeon]